MNGIFTFLPNSSVGIITNSSSMLFVLTDLSIIDDINAEIKSLNAEEWFQEPTIYTDFLAFCEEWSEILPEVLTMLGVEASLADPYDSTRGLLDGIHESSLRERKFRSLGLDDKADAEIRNRHEIFLQRNEQIDAIIESNVSLASEALAPLMPIIAWHTEEDNTISAGKYHQICDRIALPRIRTS